MDIKYREHSGNDNRQDSVVAVGRRYALNIRINEGDRVKRTPPEL